MKRSIVMICMLLLCGCSLQGKQAPLESGGQLHIQVEKAAYGEALEALWDASYPAYAGCLDFIVEPYRFTQRLQADIVWLSDLDALTLQSELQPCAWEGYAVPETLQREALRDYFLPLQAKGNLFFYREDVLQAKQVSETDLADFETMREKDIRCYHKRDMAYVYPFLAAAMPDEEQRSITGFFDQERFCKQAEAYKQLYLENHFSDTLADTDTAFFMKDTYVCGQVYVDETILQQELYRKQLLHATTMPAWEEDLHPVCVTYGFAVSKTCAYPRLAQAFLSLVRSQAGLQALLDAGMNVVLLETEAMDDFSIYDHAMKEMIAAMNDSQLYASTRIQEKPSLDVHRILARSDMLSILQNYIYGDMSVAEMYVKMQKELRSWMYRQ